MRRRWLYILFGIVAFLVMFGAGAVVGGLATRAASSNELVNLPVFLTTGEYGDEGEGILISKVEVESPADRAGLARGDILLEVNGTPVETILALQAELAKLNPGEKVDLLVKHGDDERILSTLLGERDRVAYLGLLSGDRSFPGLVVARVPVEPYKRFISPQGHGPILVEPRMIEPYWDALPEDVDQALIVGQVLQDSPAEGAGLQEGDFITALEGKPVSRPEAFTKAIQAYEPGEEIILTVFRQGEEDPQEVQVTLGEHPEEAGKGYLGVTLVGFFRK